MITTILTHNKIEIIFDDTWVIEILSSDPTYLYCAEIWGKYRNMHFNNTYELGNLLTLINIPYTVNKKG